MPLNNIKHGSNDLWPTMPWAPVQQSDPSVFWHKPDAVIMVLFHGSLVLLSFCYGFLGIYLHLILTFIFENRRSTSRCIAEPIPLTMYTYLYILFMYSNIRDMYLEIYNQNPVKYIKIKFIYLRTHLNELKRVEFIIIPIYLTRLTR